MDDLQFLARLEEVQEEQLYYPRHRRHRRYQNVKVFTLKFFYVMGKALSGELSCPSDRSCYPFQQYFSHIRMMDG